MTRIENSGRIGGMLKRAKVMIGLSLMAASPCLAQDVKLPDGFEFKTLYEIPKKTQGSWVAITMDDKGQFISSDQYGSLFRVIVGKDDKVTVKKIPVKMGGAQGLLWFKGKLFASVATKSVVPEGLYEVTDSDGDGEFDSVKLMRILNGGGEHGPHSLVPSPDGKWIYLAAGNHTFVPKGIDHFHNTNKWDEDQLIPSQPDARGHARTKKAPGGWIVRFTPDGKRYELFSQGYRNQYDMAFNVDGELFVYDADMEWDFGTPWYRPTRICHATSGSEYGWRTGTGKWPSSYIDSNPAIVDLGPGSPTGVVAGLNAKFPTRYREAIFALDWTFATIYAIHPKRTGATYTATKEEFLTSSGMPFTDGMIGKDGAMYVLTGGRRTDSAFHRISYVGNDSTAAPTPSPSNKYIEARKKLDKLHIEPDEKQLGFIIDKLDNQDRLVRYSARVALEHLPVALWLDKALAEREPRAMFQFAVAIAHQGDAAAGKKMLTNLSKVAFDKLSVEDQIGLLRAQGLIFARQGQKDKALRGEIIAQLDPHYPSKDSSVNRELCRMLSYLQAPSVVEKTLRLMATNPPTQIPEWAELASRNAKYGKDLINMLNNMPSTDNMHYAYCLRVVKGPWTEGQRRQYFEWFQKASGKSGGRSYGGFLKNIRKEAIANATPKERKMVEGWKLVKPAANPFANLPKVKGPGKNWKVEEVTALGNLKGADLANGKRMFQATLCAACHQVKNEGGGSGPDLTNAAGRFKLHDFAEAIIEPNKVVSDQYEFQIISKKDGSFITGKILAEKDRIYIVATNPFDLSHTVEVKVGDVKNIKPSPASPMPPALINRLNKKELTDLMGYLMSLK
ncbi:MAG: c-type cytochrome [Akkermansiaceae bacterium]